MLARLKNNSVVRAIYRFPGVRQVYRSKVARMVYFLPSELKLTLTKRRNPMVPPKWMEFTGKGDYLAIGQEWLGHFKDLVGLRPEDAILDVGCGIGRVAVGLTNYLNSKGAYEGFDIVPEGIGWCKDHITPLYPNFRFQLVNVQSRVYNKGGGSSAETFRFPYPDEKFDLVFLGSVFTHMGSDEIPNYLHEVNRVLKPGGASVITWFVINEVSERNIHEGRARLKFQDTGSEAFPLVTIGPCETWGYREEWIRKAYEDISLVPNFYFGSWSGRPQGLSGQDIIVARKGAKEAKSSATNQAIN